MKRFVFVLVVALSTMLSAGAQVVNPELVAKGNSLYMDGSKLGRSDLAALDGFDLKMYKSGRAMFASGVTFVALGAIPAAVSMYAMYEMSSPALKPDGTTSGVAPALLVVFGTTTVVLESVGIPLTCVGLHKIRTSANKFNSRGAELTVLPSANLIPTGTTLRPTAGVSLCLTF